jgi:hypothetical protein
VNFVNVGMKFGEKFPNSERSGKTAFGWEGVRRCVKHLANDRKYRVIGVIFENFKVGVGEPMVGVPADIRQMCESIEETPRSNGSHQKSADDEMTIKCAYRRNCHFLDNDNYRDWLRALHNPTQRAWLECNQDKLHMKYYFDTLGYFETLDGNSAIVSTNKDGKGEGARVGLGTGGRLDPVSPSRGNGSSALCPTAGSASSPTVPCPPQLPHALPQHPASGLADGSPGKPMHHAKQRLVAYRRGLASDLTDNQKHAIRKWSNDLLAGKPLASAELACADLDIAHVLEDLRVIHADAEDHDDGRSWLSSWLKWVDPFTDARNIAPGKNPSRQAINTLWYFGQAPPSLSRS